MPTGGTVDGAARGWKAEASGDPGARTLAVAACPTGAHDPEEDARWMGAVAVGLLAGAVGDRVEERPALGDGPPPGPQDVDQAVRLSLLVGAAATVLVVTARR